MSEEKKIYKVDAVIRPEKLEELKDKLYEIGVTGITVTEVYGCGLTRGQEEIYRGSVLYVNLLPKIKVEIVIYETPLDTLIDTIMSGMERFSSLNCIQRSKYVQEK